MTNFIFYLQQGLNHISDLGAYDHILFIVSLAAIYSIKQWKPLLLLVTAFTIGHSVALALATFEIVNINSALVEFLIPVSIILTCIWNLVQLHYTKNRRVEEQKKVFHVEHFSKTSYSIVIFFGLIHGLGFSNFLRFMLASDETIFTPLLAFNLGLEFGQILILTITLVINFVFLDLLKVSQKTWASIVSISVILISIPIAKDTAFALFLEQ